MKKEEFFLESRDGISKIYGVRYLPDEGNIIGIIQIIHGMAEHMGRYKEFAEFFTSCGYVVTGNDHLGHGKSVGPENLYGYFCEKDGATVVVRDVHRLKKTTQQLYPGKPYVLLGHSMGSFILRNYICRYGTGIQGAIIMSTGWKSTLECFLNKILIDFQGVFLGDKHISEFSQKVAFASYNKRISNQKTVMDWLSKDDQVIKKYIEDPLCGFSFTINGFKVLVELTRRSSDPLYLQDMFLELPILLTAGTEDPLGAYGMGIHKVKNQLEEVGMKNVELKMWEGLRHELLNEFEKQEVMENIKEWIEKQVLIKE